MKERKIRSLTKTITWRIIALGLSYLTAIFFGIDSWTSIKLVIVANGCSTLMYYIHERVWDRIKLGEE